MATLYTAKFNINEKIYQVAKGDLRLNDLLDRVFNQVNQEVKVSDIYDDDITYKFVDLYRDYQNQVLNGTIVKYFDGINSVYNEEEDTVIDLEASNKAIYVSFSFDIKSEIIGFVPKLGFSKESFIKYFELLVFKCVPEVGMVALVLVIDGAELEQKFKKMEVLKEIQVDIVPKNDDSADIASMVDILRDDLKDTNAQHLSLRLKGSVREPLVKKASLISDFKSLSKKAYAYFFAKGRDQTGSEFTIDTRKDTHLKRTISDNNKNASPLIAEITQELSQAYKAQKAQEVINNGGE